jgi:hypothetical protein
MSKLLTKKITSFLALTLTFAMCFATIALANDEPPHIGNLVENPGEIKIDSTLQMPIGTTTPDAEFNYLVSKISLDGNKTDASKLPNLNTGEMNVSYDFGDEEPADTNNTISITKATDDIFKNVEFPRAGVYEYLISQQPNSNSLIDNNDPYEAIRYSTAEYTLKVYVVNEDNGGTKIETLAIIVEKQDNSQQTVGHKVPKMVFTNDYVKTNGPTDPERPNLTTESTLSISNTVGGNYGDKTQYFDFKITPAVHELYTTVGEFFRAYIVDENGVVEDIAANGANIGEDLAGQSYIEIASNGTTSFKLKDGQKLVFVDTPVGTSYNVDMTLVNNYDASFKITANNMPTITGTPGTGATVLSTGTHFVGESKNSADFTNVFDDELIVPTGINMNNVPFIGIILLPIIALVLYIAFKTRKNKQAN